MTKFDVAVPDYADVFTVQDFLDMIIAGAFTNDDGCGHWVKDGMMAGSEYIDCDDPNPADGATHVAWFNK
jgi:hypothetical protein